MTSAIIVTYRGGKHLNACLQTVIPQHFNRVVVVYTGSEPLDIDERAIKVAARSNSYAHALNAGLRYTNDDHALILNDDTLIAHDLRTKLQRWEKRKPTIVAPRILLKHDTIENGGHWLFSDGFNVARGRGRHPDIPLPKKILVFSGAAFWIHSKALQNVGPFDEELGSYGEDVDYSLRAIRLGIEIIHDPEIQLIHALGATRGRASGLKAKLVEQNRIQAALRSLPKRSLINMPLASLKRYILMSTGALFGRGVAGMGDWKTVSGAIAGQCIGLTMAPRALQKRRQDSKEWQLSGNEMHGLMQENRPPLKDIWHPNLDKT